MTDHAVTALSSVRAAPTLAGDRCKCSACGQYFNSTYLFDRHRDGSLDDFGKHRRCLTVHEMIVSGRWTKNVGGHWVSCRQKHIAATAR